MSFWQKGLDLPKINGKMLLKDSFIGPVFHTELLTPLTAFAKPEKWINK